MKRNKLQKTVFSVICIVLAVIMMLSLVITVLPAHAVDETDLERLAEKRAQLEEQLMEQEQVIQGLTENQTLIVFLAIGILVGAFGGAMAIRNYLKV